MTIARPAGIIRTAVFFAAFAISVIPVWFALLSWIPNGFISGGAALVLILGIVLCRSYVESEIAGAGFGLFAALRAGRFVSGLLKAAAVYAGILIILFAPPFFQALAAAAFIVIILLSFRRAPDGYWRGYSVPFIARVVTVLLWLHAALSQDTTFGRMSAIIGAYALEFYILLFGKPLSALPHSREPEAAPPGTDNIGTNGSGTDNFGTTTPELMAQYKNPPGETAAQDAAALLDSSKPEN